MGNDILRPGFFQLYSSVDEEIRRKLEAQFNQLTKKISQVNRLLIDLPNLVGEKENFIRFHNEILDEEFRNVFGFTEIVIVYLYKLKENDFDRVYVPESWSVGKRMFMDQAIKDLRNFYLGGEKPDDLSRKKHLFLEILDRVEGHKINEEFQSYTRFISEINRNVSDAGGPLNLAPEAEQVFKDDMIIVTPLHNEEGEFWVTVNTCVNRHASLFGQVGPEHFNALKRWYVIVHEAISECFLSVAHLLRLREKSIEHDTLQRISIISYLLSHPSVKLFTTPLKNAADELRELDPIFPDDSKKRERFETILDNVQLITDLWEGNLVVLEEFGAIEGNNNYSLDCQDINADKWLKIEDALRQAAEVLFFNHINDLYDDPNYNNLAEPILRRRKLEFSDFFRLSISLHEGPVCYGHPKLIVMHLISFLENAIEAADFTIVADHYLKGKRIIDKHKNLISYKLYSEKGFGIIEVENDCRVSAQEEKNLIALNDFIKTFSDDRLRIKSFKKALEERNFTTKSGTGFGWAVILAADYFYRLSVVDYEGLQTKRYGEMSIDVVRDTSGSPVGVKVRISLPIPNTGEKVRIENGRAGKQ
jgi:hypothetical protein